MDADLFDLWTRALGSAGTRRGALVSLLGGAIGLFQIAEADARRRKRRRRRRRRRRAGRGPGAGPGTGTEPELDEDLVCSGAESCGSVSCGSESALCHCYVEEDTALPVCVGSFHLVLNCGQCSVEEKCIDLSACGGGSGAVGCALPCA
jgi:hypothetical protein